jgi:hypothetical protein
VNDLVPATQTTPPTPSMSKLSLTNDIREFLLQNARQTVTSEELARNPLEDIYKLAAEHNMALYELIQLYPNQVVRAAEKDVSDWTQIMAEAALTGYIVTESGNTKVNKNISDLIKYRVEVAKQTLDTVTTYAFSATAEGTLKKDQLIQTLYKHAIIKGNTRALMYLVDRVDGRVTETKTLGFDYDNAYNVYQTVHCMFDKQLQVLNSGCGTKIVCCSRRAGKTTLAGALILIECLRMPNTTCIYIGKTMELAESLLYEAMNLIVDICHLKNGKGERLNFKKFDNGSKILIRGLSNTKDPDMIRGQKAKVIVIDEFFHMTEDGLLEYMITEVLEPMQMDFASDHTMLLIGTPPKVKGTYGEKMWLSERYMNFRWTFRDNPFPIGQDKEAYVEAKLKEKGLDWNSPYAQREYGGQFAYDEDALLYPIFSVYDPESYVPNLHVTSVYCGIDYGVSDCNAVIGVAWDNDSRRGFVFFESKFNRLQVDKTISMLEHLKREVKYLWEMSFDFFPSFDMKEANKRILWDADSSDQQLTQELMFNVRHREDPTLKLQIDDAHKTDKILMQDKIRDLLRSGALLLPIGSKTVQECEKTIMKRDDKGNILADVDEKYYHPDLLPALRYAMWNAVGMEVQNEKQGIDFTHDVYGVFDHDNTEALEAIEKHRIDKELGYDKGSGTGY